MNVVELPWRMAALFSEAGLLEGITQPKIMSLCAFHSSWNTADAQQICIEWLLDSLNIPFSSVVISAHTDSLKCLVVF